MQPHLSKRLKISIIVVILILISLTVGSGFSKSRNGTNSEVFDGLQLFAEVLNKIQANYVEEVQPKKLIYGAIRGMVSTLDPYSQFMDTDQYEDLETDTKGEYGGLGIHIVMKDNWLTVESPMEGTPAFKAGIKEKDRIIEIDDKSTEGITLEQAAKKLRGPKGSKVKLLIERAGMKKPLAFTLTRDVIILESVTSKMFNGDMKIAYIRIKEFREKTGEDLGQTLRKLQKEGMQAIILDLRYNPGGLLKSSIEVSDYFIPADKVVVSTKGRAPGNDQEYRTDGSVDKYLNLPMVCLVNEGSASAAEIVAGCLQDHKRAILIGPEGKRTYGKGSVQAVMELRNNTALRLTTAKYFTPSGRSIHGQGLKSDIEVPIPKETEDSILLAGKLGELTVPKVTLTINEDSTVKFDISEKEKVEDVQLAEGIKILKISKYFKTPGIVDLPPVSQSTATTAHSKTN
jgi:carboxyl-terminal processing protease